MVVVAVHEYSRTVDVTVAVQVSIGSDTPLTLDQQSELAEAWAKDTVGLVPLDRAHPIGARDKSSDFLHDLWGLSEPVEVCMSAFSAEAPQAAARRGYPYDV